MSRQGWEDHSVHTANSSRYDPTHTSLRGGGSSRPVTPASSVYSEYMLPQRHTTTVASSKKKTPGKKSAPVTAQNLPHHKAGRVKVGIRIRPVFQDEIESIRGPFTPIISAQGAPESSSELGKVILNVGGSKQQREFKFDYTFGPKASQDHVYDRVARPVVTDVLSGFNGTIFAYGKQVGVYMISCSSLRNYVPTPYHNSVGQTGTGKTYTMGILEAVNDDHAGMMHLIRVE